MPAVCACALTISARSQSVRVLRSALGSHAQSVLSTQTARLPVRGALLPSLSTLTWQSFSFCYNPKKKALKTKSNECPL